MNFQLSDDQKALQEGIRSFCQGRVSVDQLRALEGPGFDKGLWQELAATPYAHDLFQTLRRVQALKADAPRLGEALRPRDEAVRLGQDAELDADGPVGRAQDRGGLFHPEALHVWRHVLARLLPLPELPGPTTWAADVLPSRWAFEGLFVAEAAVRPDIELPAADRPGDRETVRVEDMAAQWFPVDGWRSGRDTPGWMLAALWCLGIVALRTIMVRRAE